ncbi:type I secretion system permease/ATPase [Rhizobium johnstonii]|uniref:ATP-binding component of Type I protein secretion system n=9 Tax=Rhizobium TaxID=379 RepID=Q1MN92_RHIJ3|nr:MULTISPECIES: type I secretion system permease/ATPase [Rhizobium]QIO66790.1 type I secretion system permease/ATPase [Rhizobium leguminosarum bv. trifolii]TBG23240.1 type I secretion system permease/ATPase [Rhizobium leguminosarum]UIK17563.1 type I secretion system permease/ATPase [Rhizobium leguminosarum]WSH08087.1 type I secretion system permease/ATPase [Rhizobium johnstonii]WSH44363.1 type I secretion system permease/ATPase [Rhizobium johnstonii]
MNQISKQIFAAGSALDLRSGTIPSAAPSEATMTDVCVSAIDEAVENLRRLSGAAASSPDRPKKTSEAAANEAADIGRASATQAPLPEKMVVPEAKVETAPPVAVAQGLATAKTPEAPARPQIEARVSPEQPKEKIELKSSPTMPFAKTIEGESGPISENNRRMRAGGGGNGKDSDPGGGGGGGGGSGGGFHKRSEPVNFAASLSRGMAAVRHNMVVVMMFTIAINVLLLAIPLYLFQISDRVLTSRSVDTLVMLSIAVIGAVLLQAFMDSVRRFILMRTAVELEVQLGAPILSAAARASLHGSGKDYQTLQDLQLLRGFLTSGTLIAFLDAPLMPFFVVVVYFVHPHLGIIIMVCCAVLFVIAYLNQKFTARQFAESNGYLSRANFHLDSMSRNSQIINAMAMIPEAVKMWGRETAGSLKSQVEAQDRNIIFSGISKACRMITQVTLLGWGAHLSLSGELTGGMVIAASIISGRALAPIEGAIEGWNQFNRSAAAYSRIKGLLLNSPLNFPRLRLPNPEGRLDVERILFVPPPQKKVILNGISFSLRKGESLAIIGNSGSGKTTLGKMLVGSIVPTSGNVRLDLMDLRNWDQRQFGESIGYLPQDVQLFPGTIKANICRMRDDVDDHQIYDAAVLADVHELIAGFPQGYETIVAADGAPLSGGQKQRIALARAFFGNPKFVVLDEPNSNLDTQGEAALAKALIHAKKQGITTVTITQRPALLQCVDKILVLKDGTVAMFGERIEVLQALSKNNGNNGQQAPRIEG